MKVRFQNDFMVPGFGRSRFKKGVCMDVPEALRNHLPSSAEILPDDYEEVENRGPHEAAAATKYAEEQAAAKLAADAMNASGMDGWADETDPTVGPQPKQPEPDLDGPEDEGDEPQEKPAEEKPSRAKKKGK
tara:strand:+ start:479 stop:874 length:396 start_codon:yes stop_codon:yes gene_type:complete